ncbi:DUF3667 domain-containing protein [Chitinophaga sp. HK235]|uniref:DUF3667 domain-containing protein n=1 Tax=Chitinophaga sp. HK235 TaxID=2952571 RepID=UPI001BA8D179|nr:DUF3667 domain-containing protein [Chitinophaga sp. HK235]
MRKDKHCLNCGSEVPERFCSHCGQENTVQHETFGHLVGHFVADIFHYDSQLLLTLKYLAIRPGLLSKEYWAGRRAMYVNPIKLYVFVSFVFFFFFFTLANGPDHGKNAHAVNRLAEREAAADLTDININGLDPEYNSVAEYDSAQAALPEHKRSTGWDARMQRGMAKLRENKKEGKEVLKEMFSHNLPKVMFILLPLFALLMKWSHRRSKMVYADHAIFTIHFHSFLFIILFVGLVLRYFIRDQTPLDLAYWGAFGYLVLGLRNAYKQSFWKSFVKASLLCIAYLFVCVTVFVVFIVGVLSFY